MARKPSSHQPLLPFADDTPIPDDTVPPLPEGNHHAVQDDRARTPQTTSDAPRPAPSPAAAAAAAGTLGPEAEGPPPLVAGADQADEAGQPAPPARERGAGDRPPGTPGPFVLRLGAGRTPTALPRRRDGLPPPSHA